ncbi:hypothetical protein ACO1O0_008797 [Amphichorda felina]
MATRLGPRVIAQALSQCPAAKPCKSPIHSLRLRLPTSVSHPRSSYTTKASSSPEAQPQRSKILRRGLILVVVLGGTVYYLATPPSAKSTTLNDITFVPYTITSRTALSPSSFVLTVVPQTANPDPPYFLPGTDRWRHPLWSVEFKQPEVQISRHYTPLPPCSRRDAPTTPTDADHGGEADGALRFYIRTVGDGEMSRYLNRLRVGHAVHLRGPHVGFDLVGRLGASKSIVFLAGGTGVVPGMQAARVALEGYEDTRVSLLWAVRHRDEIQRVAGPPEAPPAGRSWWDLGWRSSSSSSSPEPSELDPALEAPSPVARQLADMKRQYGPRFNVQVVVDEEKSAFHPQHVQKALAGICESDTSSPSPSHPGTGCSLHDQKLHERAPEFEASKPECECAPVDGALPGKNLFIVSGPDGFVTHYAGTKEWRGGQHTQGPVGGVVGQVQSQNPQLARDWLVLKL